MALALGVLCLCVAIAPPLAFLDHRLLTFHMIKHLLLMSVAPPLVLSGLKRLRPTISPVVCWFAGTVALMGWHIPAVFNAAMRRPWIHAVEDISFVLAGLLFWLPIMRAPDLKIRAESWFIPLYLYLATLPCDILSAFLVFCGRLVYPHYSHAPRLFHLSPAGDQQLAGALMWVAVTFIYLTPATIFTLRALSPNGIPQGVTR